MLAYSALHVALLAIVRASTEELLAYCPTASAASAMPRMVGNVLEANKAVLDADVAVLDAQDATASTFDRFAGITEKAWFDAECATSLARTRPAGTTE